MFHVTPPALIAFFPDNIIVSLRHVMSRGVASFYKETCAGPVEKRKDTDNKE
jgi:hypothetical protein